MLQSQLDAHSQETLNYLRAMKQKIMEEQTEEVLQQAPKTRKKRSLFAAIKELPLSQYNKTRIYQ